MKSIKLNCERFYRAIGLAIALTGFTLAGANNLLAQTSTGAVRGYVTVGGAPVSDAQVIARLAATNETRNASTNSAGFYYLPGLRPGTYEITVRRVGLQPQTRTITLPIGQTLDVNVTTGEVAQQLQAVQVISSSSGQETRTSEVGTNISREQIQNLPNFERNVLDLAKLVPGVSTQAVNNTDKFFAAGGQPPEAVNVFVDGASYKNDVLRGGTVGQDASKGNPLPQSAIQEFRVLTQNYKAEYQKAASAIIVATTRSGTNELEAEVFANGIGKAYVARDEFAVRNNSPRPNYQRLQAGGAVGGPIMKDKLFFFGTYELNFRDEPKYVRVGGDSSFAPAALLTRLRAQEGQQAEQFREHLGLGKLTWNFNERNTVDASFTVRKDDDFRGFGGETSFEASENLAIDTYTGVANWKHSRGSMLNEFQVNTQFFTWNPTGRNYGMLAEQFNGLMRVGGKDTEQNFKQNRISLRDDITFGGIQLAGDHVFKTGVNVDFLSYDGTKYFYGNPVYRYQRSQNWAQPYEVELGYGDPNIQTDNKQFGVFLQDDWSIGRKLLLNLGIRWDAETNGINNDYVTPAPLADSLRAAYAAGGLTVDRPNATGPATVVNVIQQLGGIENYVSAGSSTRKMYKKAFQPRLGASYDIRGDGSTVLFGGGGLYFDRNYWNTLFDEQFRRQFSVIRIAFPAAGCAPGATNCATWNPSYYDPAALRALAVSTGEPEVFLVKNDMVPPRTLQMSFGVRQDLGRQRMTLSYNGLRGENYMNFIRGSPWGGGSLPYNTVFVADDRVKTWYNALQMQLQRPLQMDTRWGGGLSYTLAKSEEQGQSQDIFWGFDDRYPTVADRPRILAPNDQRHAIVANAIVKLPANFLFSTIINLASGIAVNASDNSRGFGVDQRRTYIFQTPTRPFLGIGQVFGYQNMDVRLEKGFQLAQRSSASLMVDVFNVFNSDNFGCYNNSIDPTTGPPNPNYGKAGCAGLGRRLQVGLRYVLRPLSESR